jgi:hypothetical protein
MVKRFGLVRSFAMIRKTAFVVAAVLIAAQIAPAQDQPLNFENNYFVTGDYVIAGWDNKTIAADRAGYATGTISIPDLKQSTAIKIAQANVRTQVPEGADIVAAFLYWTTVEKSQSAFAGQIAYFNGYQITGAILGNPNAPVSWSSGGCAGASNGATTMRAYRVDVRKYLPVGANGISQPNTSYTVEFADSGSNGNTAPFTLGATLVILYRVISPDFPLNAIVLYDGAFAPSNTSSVMTQVLQGFYQPGPAPNSSYPSAKLTHIVANGQSKKNETVTLNGTPLPQLYGKTLPPFPGLYNQDWDNATWDVSKLLNAAPNDPSDTTAVTPSASNSGCVSWGTIIFSTTVKDSDGDGLLDYWEQSPSTNPPPTAINPGKGALNPNGDPGYIDVGTGQFVALPGANPNQKDIFIQLDYMCSSVVVNADYSTTCNTSSGGVSFLPPANALTTVANTFSSNGHNVNVHYDIKNAIPEQTCTDDNTTSPPSLCVYPNQSGVAGWKAGLLFLKNQPLNYPDESSCATRTPVGGSAGTGPVCIRRFLQGRKDSYHYVMAANALGGPNWAFQGGSLTSIDVGANGVATFMLTSPSGLAVDKFAGNGRVTIADAIKSRNLNGTYLVTGVTNPNPGDLPPYQFTIQTQNVPAGSYNLSTDPKLTVTSGQGGTGSGYSDLGGQDSLITLGLWGDLGQPVSVQAGTFAHELGHTLGLPHGGLYFDKVGTGSYLPTLEPNCKPNYQSIMSYLFQVDLLDGNTVDYSEQELIAANEPNLSNITALTATNGAATFYQTTSWYSPTPVNAGKNPSSANAHCDGTPLLPTDPPMYRLFGGTNPILPAWASNQDINFNGKIDASLRGYNDWARMDLRQVGATGSLSVFAGITGGGLNGDGGITGGGINGDGGITGGGINGDGGITGGGINGDGGVGRNEITKEAANSVVRPPRNLNGSVTPPPRYIQLTWLPPTFGTVSFYNLYKSVDGTADPASPIRVMGTSYLDKNVTCGPTYTYFVTAVLTDGRESIGSNSVSLKDCAPPYVFAGFFSPMTTADPPNAGSYSGQFNATKSITPKWTLQDSTGTPVTNLAANTLYVTGPYSAASSGPACNTSQAPLIFSYNGVLPGNVSTLYSPTSGAKGNSTFRSSGQFIFNWDTTGFALGCYVMELDLDSGQVFRTSLLLR